MRRFLVPFFLVAILLAGTLTVARAQSTVNQGAAGSSDWPINTAARYGGKTTQVLVTNSAGGSAVPATALGSRKALELQNLGPNPIYCTVDGQSPLADGSLGRRIDANGGTWSLDAGPKVAVKCIAATAAQLSTAATMVTELR